MKAITQQHSYGCGIACTAFVSNQDYETTLREFDDIKARQKGFYCSELVEVLHHLGLNYEWKFITDEIYDNGIDEMSIVYLKRSNQYPEGHYMVRTKGGWMDPWVNFNTNKDVSKAKSGFIDQLPYRPSYVIRPIYS